MQGSDSDSDQEVPKPAPKSKVAMHASPIVEESESQLSTHRDDDFYDAKELKQSNESRTKSLNSSKEKKQTPTRTQEVKRYGQMKVEDFLDSQSDEEEKYYRHLDEKRDESRVESSVSEIRVEVAVNDDA